MTGDSQCRPSGCGDGGVSVSGCSVSVSGYSVLIGTVGGDRCVRGASGARGAVLCEGAVVREEPVVYEGAVVREGAVQWCGCPSDERRWWSGPGEQSLMSLSTVKVRRSLVVEECQL